MGKSSAFENDLLKLIFQGTNIANLADNTATDPVTSLYVSLHSADPAGGTQSTNEISYTTYARVAVARASGAGGWTITDNSVSPTDNIVFPTPTVLGSGAGNYVGIGLLASGAGELLYSGALTPAITVALGSPPTVLATSTLVET